MPEPTPHRSRRELGFLALIVVAAAIYHWVQARGRVTPWIFPDEIRYAEAARAVAATGVPTVRGVTEVTGAVHAYLLAPAWLIDDVGTAWAVAQAVNALAFASAAIPVYLMARPLCSRGPALAAAGASVLLPAAFYVSTLMTEAVAFPVVLWAVLAAMRLAGGGGFRWLAVLAGACLLGAGVRDQLLVLPLAAAATVALGRRASLGRAARLAIAAAGVVAVAALALWVLGGDGVAAARHALVDRRGVAVRSALDSAGATAVALWAVPAVAYGASLGWLGRAQAPERRALAAALAAFGAVLIAYTGVKAAIFGGITESPEERNLIYLQPLALVALAAAAGRAGRLAAAAASVAVAGLVLGTPLANLPSSPILSENPGTSWLWHVALGPEGLEGWVRPLMLGLAAAGAAVVLVPRPRLLAWSVVPVALALVWTGSLTYRGDHRFSEAVAARWVPAERDWIDRRAGGATAGVVVTDDLSDLSGIWSALFWNRSLTRIAEVDNGLLLVPGPRGVGPGGEVGLGDAAYALSSGAAAMRGDLVARAGLDGYRLTRLTGDPRLAARLEGRLPDAWGGEELRVTRYGAGPAGTVEVPASAANPVIAEERTVILLRRDEATDVSAVGPGWTAAGRTRLAPGAGRTLRVRVPGGPFTVAVRVYPLTSPAELGISPDVRRLGLQYGAVRVPGLAAPL